MVKSFEISIHDFQCIFQVTDEIEGAVKLAKESCAAILKSLDERKA